MMVQLVVEDTKTVGAWIGSCVVNDRKTLFIFEIVVSEGGRLVGKSHSRPAHPVEESRRRIID
jgi:hypothetical protein